MRTLYLADFSNWMYKFLSVYSIKRKINGVEMDISALYGFMRALKANPFTDIHICLDGYPENSLEYLPSYKGQRIKEPSEGIFLSKKTLVKFLTGYGEYLGKNIKVVASAGQEADQVIASQVYQICGNLSKIKVKVANMSRRPPIEDRFLKRVLQEDYKYSDIDLSGFDSVVIGTTDSDMYQLLELDGVMIDTTTSGKSFNLGEYTPKSVMGLKPSAISVYKSFVGDVSDNVPPIKTSLKKDRLIDLISRKIPTKDELNSFIRKVSLNIPFEDKELRELAEQIIKNDQIKMLETNKKVVELCYVSTPYKIEYENNDIYEILQKVNLNLK